MEAGVLSFHGLSSSLAGLACVRESRERERERECGVCVCVCVCKEQTPQCSAGVLYATSGYSTRTADLAKMRVPFDIAGHDGPRTGLKPLQPAASYAEESQTCRYLEEVSQSFHVRHSFGNLW